MRILADQRLTRMLLTLQPYLSSCRWQRFRAQIQRHHFHHSLSPFKRKTIFRLPLHIGSNRKQAPCEAIAPRSLGRGGGDEKSLQIGATKGTGRDVLHGHLHDTIDFSVGSDAHNAVPRKTAIPQITFRVDRRTVGIPAPETFQKWTFVGNRTGRGIVIVDPNDVGERVSKIEVALVGTPGQRNGYSNLLPEAGGPAIRIDANQNAVLPPDFARGAVRMHIVAHGASPKRTARIWSCFIQAN